MLDQRILRLREYLYQRGFVQFAECRNYRQTSDELRYQPEFDQVLGLYVAQYAGDTLAVVLTAHFGAKADAAFFGACANHFFQAIESATDNEQNIGGIDLHEFLIRMLASALRGHRSCSALNQLQQSLLHALARHVAGNRWVIRFARNFVDFVNVDDAALRLFNIVIALLQQFLNDVFDVLAHVACFGQRSGIGHDERYIEHPRQCLRQQRLAGTRRADQQNVRFSEFDIVFFCDFFQTLVVVIYGH